ncbi:MAG: Uma2 family endonuclease [Pirellulales bacterium]
MSTVSHFTLAQYERMVEGGVFAVPGQQRVELIRGEIRQMSPIGSRHACAVDWLAEWSFESTSRTETKVRIQGPTRIPELESEPEPDILWLDRKKYATAHPCPDDIQLLIEVAESSLAMDLGEKMLLYAEAGIRDYWVVDLVADCVHVFREPRPSGYASHSVHRGDEAIRPLAAAAAALVPGELFAATHESSSG